MGGVGSTGFHTKIPPNCKNKASGEVYLLNFFASFVFLSLSQKFGGILGWDPVLTTCILCEKVITPRPTIEMNKEHESHHRVDHEKNCEAIYWKHHTSHILTQNSHTTSFKTFFFTKITFLLRTSKIPYQNTVR